MRPNQSLRNYYTVLAGTDLCRNTSTCRCSLRLSSLSSCVSWSHSSHRLPFGTFWRPSPWPLPSCTSHRWSWGSTVSPPVVADASAMVYLSSRTTEPGRCTEGCEDWCPCRWKGTEFRLIQDCQLLVLQKREIRHFLLLEGGSGRGINLRVGSGGGKSWAPHPLNKSLEWSHLIVEKY